MSDRPLDLGWMRIFTDVARRGSLTAAAASLRLTQPAVSYQMRKLEDELGVVLIRRKHRGIELTAEGQKLFDIVSRNVDAIDLLAQQLRRTEDRQTIRLHTDYAFSSLWLIPRMHGFRALNPDINIQIVATQDPLGQGKHDSDVMIIFGTRQEAGDGAVLLLSEKVTPVCSPALLADAAAPASVADLTRLKLIHLENTSQAHWFDWPSYFKHFGVLRGPENDGGDISFNNYTMVVQATIGEQGFALGWAGLIDPLLEAGVLVTAGPSLDAPGRGYWLMRPKNSDNAVRKLTGWLIDERR
ncbi:LysR family transcriptional regulator [Agrobacterium radiobacter]|jgi:putative choline sulfate-utilization transcription factor|uniref:HTH-type transcriptional regulator TtuA n=1 Tax=Agrobacterium tumefaciens str. B6 TaxID=1183423 RepID=A0A822V665_AGRTU|nr:LysR family transcriptional regulator [Agrobacterium tumefaciens]AYM08676.1 LysR family transcriptional regulator [Agrobacterium tumefaciens]KWT81665.1 LysR family transcriptional regulator [Agrobacterium tumefaciens str. B6]MQB26619.1 LysR family transcriptional regulator [Agrobacterium tumefaciens]NSZ35385.1 LysR family transcriptional regulator [Agrobacterium tumefaciens]NTA08068.1 LysR family transcriptional regulator [Agrobacterium tumefaciens]